MVSSSNALAPVLEGATVLTAKCVTLLVPTLQAVTVKVGSAEL